MEQIPLNDYLVWKAFNLSTDQIVTISLAILLLLKYTFYDKPAPSNANSLSTLPSPPKDPLTNSNIDLFPSEAKDITSLYFRKRSINLETIPEVNSSDEIFCNNETDTGIIIPAATATTSNIVTMSNSCTQTDNYPVDSVAMFSIRTDNDTDDSDNDDSLIRSDTPPHPPRPVNECLKIYNTEVRIYM